jgi:acyl-CoA synthetase (AMP-forming)/AMP-acid ligase II
VAIVDPTTAVRQPDGQMGEVWVTGSHVAAGYHGRGELNGQTFGARLMDDPRSWLRTGDLGFLRDGELHISGRIKDLLIINGRKHHPEDLEATIQSLVSVCAPGTTVAFQADVDDVPCLVVAVELAERPTEPAARMRLVDAIRTAVWTNHGVLIDVVAMVRVGRLPRTTSGKVRRHESRDLWAAGGLADTGQT